MAYPAGNFKNPFLSVLKYFLNLFLGLLDFVRFDFNRFNKVYFDFLKKHQKLNGTFLKEGKYADSDYFVQNLPDRYSSNAALYRQMTAFQNFGDIEKWIKGNYFNNITDLSRYFFINLCIDYLLEENLTGNVVEIGVYKGNSAFLLSKFARTRNNTCYLFDTFEGFDSRDLNDTESALREKAFTDTSLDIVKEIAGNENTVFIKGYFPESLNQITEINDLIIVHIDCDLERPVISALNYFYPRIKSGGFLIMHDHSSLYWPGAEKAINEFFRNKLEYIIPVPDKSGTCVVRKV